MKNNWQTSCYANLGTSGSGVSETSSSRATVDLGYKLISKRLGLIHSLAERRSGLDNFSLTDYVAWLGDSRPVTSSSVQKVNGGNSPDRIKALAAAIGESVERYSLSLYHPTKLKWATFQEIGTSGCKLEDLTWFLDEQYQAPEFPLLKPNQDWKTARYVAWVEGYSSAKQSKIYFPASLVFLPYSFGPNEPAFSYQVSSGTSCARSLYEAALRATLEVIERDALTICWESRSPYPAINQAVVAEAASNLFSSISSISSIGRLARSVELYAYDITTDLEIPVILTLAVASQGGSPAIAIGVAADFDAWSALSKSVAEAITSWRSTAYLCREEKRSAPEILADMRRRTVLTDHALYYSHKESLSHFNFLLDAPLSLKAPNRFNCPAKPRLGGNNAQPENSQALLSECKNRLSQAGHDLLLFDLTQTDIAEAGLYVVRAIVPTLVRQTIGLFVRHLRNPRIWEVPHRLGYASQSNSSASAGGISQNDLLRNLHPFP